MNENHNKAISDKQFESKHDQETKAGEPVAWIVGDHPDGIWFIAYNANPRAKQTPLYTAPPDTEALRQRAKELELEFNGASSTLDGVERRVEELEATIAIQVEQIKMAREGFNKLARLGNGDHLGGSTGNLIAQEYLSKLGEQ